MRNSICFCIVGSDVWSVSIHSRTAIWSLWSMACPYYSKLKLKTQRNPIFLVFVTLCAFSYVSHCCCFFLFCFPFCFFGISCALVLKPILRETRGLFGKSKKGNCPRPTQRELPAGWNTMAWLSRRTRASRPLPVYSATLLYGNARSRTRRSEAVKVNVFISTWWYHKYRNNKVRQDVTGLTTRLRSVHGDALIINRSSDRRYVWCDLKHAYYKRCVPALDVDVTGGG